MEYNVIIEDSNAELIKEVNEAIKNVWELQGGVSIVITSQASMSFFFAQAMVKRD